jgi:hypothetical protein
MPAVTFTPPQLASAGWTETEARRHGHEVTTRLLDLVDVPRAVATATAACGQARRRHPQRRGARCPRARGRRRRDDAGRHLRHQGASDRRRPRRHLSAVPHDGGGPAPRRAAVPRPDADLLLRLCSRPGAARGGDLACASLEVDVQLGDRQIVEDLTGVVRTRLTVRPASTSTRAGSNHRSPASISTSGAPATGGSAGAEAVRSIPCGPPCPAGGRPTSRSRCRAWRTTARRRAG